jgi:DNA repair protein RadC
MMTLCIRQDNGRYRTATETEITHAAAELIRPRLERRNTLTSPEEVREFLAYRLRPIGHELFACLFLDNRHRLIEYSELFRGTIDGASVHPREVVKEALRLNAAAVIFAHNHPSGVAEPSQSDIRITQRLKDALALIDVRVLDHLIVGEGVTVSLAERGLL